MKRYLNLMKYALGGVMMAFALGGASLFVLSAQAQVQEEHNVREEIGGINSPSAQGRTLEQNSVSVSVSGDAAEPLKPLTHGPAIHINGNAAIGGTSHVDIGSISVLRNFHWEFSPEPSLPFALIAGSERTNVNIHSPFLRNILRLVLTGEHIKGVNPRVRAVAEQDFGGGRRQTWYDVRTVTRPSYSIEGLFAEGETLTIVVNSYLAKDSGNDIVAGNLNIRAYGFIDAHTDGDRNGEFSYKEIKRFPHTSKTGIRFISTYKVNAATFTGLTSPATIQLRLRNVEGNFAIVHTPTVTVGGAISMDGDGVVGSIMTANRSGLTDTGGAYTTYRYQWLRRGDESSTFTQIPGATGSTYAVTDDTGEKPQLQLLVTHNNGLGFVNSFSTTEDILVAGDFRVDGVPVVFATLSANISGLSQEAGVTYTYQWAFRSNTDVEFNEVGTDATYVINSANVRQPNETGTPQLRMSVSREFGGVRTPYVVTLDILNPVRRIEGVFAVGEVLTAVVSNYFNQDGIVLHAFREDPDNSGEFTFDGHVLSSGTTLYTVNVDDFPNETLAQIQLSLQGVSGDFILTHTPTVTVGGAIGIDGNGAVGSIMTANRSGLTGTGGAEASYTYQWSRRDNESGTFTLIVGAANSTYTIADDTGVKPQLQLAVTHNNGLGFENSFSTTEDILKGGIFQVDGVPVIFSTVSANISGLAALAAGATYTYQWAFRSNTDVDFNQVGTNAAYRLPESSVRQPNDTTGRIPQLRVSVLQDNSGAETSYVVTLDILNPALPQIGGVFAAGEVLTAVVSNYFNLVGIDFHALREDPDNPGEFTFDGHRISQASTLYTVNVDDFPNTTLAQIQVRLFGVLGTTVLEHTPIVTVGGVVGIDGSGVIDSTITANLSDLTDTGGTDASYTYQWLRRGDESGTFATIVGATNSTYAIAFSDSAGEKPQFQSAVIHNNGLGFVNTLFGTSDINLPSVQIDGVFAAGEVVTAVSNINGGATTHAWYASIDGGSSFSNTPIATTQNYNVTIADFTGTTATAQLRVVVGGANGESATTAITYTPTTPVNGGIGIDGLREVGAILTANISGLNNTLSAATYTYQWARRNSGGGGFTPISGETNSTYTIVEEDETAGVLQLSVLYTDALGYTASFVFETGIAVVVNVTRNGTSFTFTANPVDDAGIVSGGYTYQWQQSETANGDYTNIAGEINDSYTVPSNYDASREHLRVSVSYAITGGGSAFSFSRSTVVAGIDSGTVSATGGGFGAGATRRANIGDLSSVLGQEVQAAQVRYQWQVSNAENGTYSDISGAESQTYALAVADFTDSNRYLRVRIIDLADESNTRDSDGELIEQPSTGAVSINGSIFAPGGVFTANTSGVRDINGTGTYTYEWMRGDGASFSPQETGETYALVVSDFTGITTPDLRLVVGHTDAFGFVVALTSEITVSIQSAATGGIVINTSAGYADSNVLSLDNSISDANGDGILDPIEWQYRSSSNSSNSDFVTLLTSPTYTIASANWAGSDEYDELRAVATHTDPFGEVVLFTAAVVEINQAAVGQPRIMLIDGGVAKDGLTLELDESITDANGDGGLTDHRWADRNNSTNVGTPQNNDTQLVLNQAAADELGAGNPINLTFTHTDGLGFTTAFTVSYRQLEVLVSIRSNRVEGRANDENDISTGSYTYRWQQSATESGSYTPISGATSTSYIVPSNYDISMPFVRLDVGYVLSSDDTKATVSSPGIRAVGVVNGGEVSFPGGGGTYTGATRTAAIGDIEDLFGRRVGSNYLTYQWQVSDLEDGTYTDIGATAQTYTLSAADFKDNNARYLRVQVGSAVAGDDSYNGTVSAGEDIQSVGGGNIAINTSGGFADGDSLSLNNNLTDENSRGTVITLTNIVWESIGDTVVEVTTGTVYAINRTDWATGDNTPATLRAHATYTDAFGGVMSVTAAVININRETSAELEVVVVDDTDVTMGAVLSLSITALSDANGALTNTVFAWNGNAPIKNEQEYELTSTDVSLLAASSLTLSVVVTFTDELGFTQDFVVALSQIRFEEPQAVEMLGVLNAAELSGATDVIRSVLSGPIGADAGGEPQTYLEINGVEVDEATDITRAFAARTSDSLRKDAVFGIDKFKVAYAGTDESGMKWSSWAQIGWSNLSGAPTVDDSVLKYDGSNFGVYVGADREFSDSVRAGVAVGISKTDIDMDLNEDNILDDNIVRDLNSILPYLQWRGADSRGSLLLMGGYGIGELELQQADGCRSSRDVDWLMGSLQGNYKMPITKDWDVEFDGGINNSQSSLDSGRCSGRGSGDLPGSESNSGEGSLGVETGWTSPLTHGGTFRPYINVGVRTTYGDLDADAAYDLGGGFNIALPSKGLKFGISGKHQINDTTHNRDSINGALSLKHGAYESSFKTTYNAADNKGGLAHRWEFNRISEWGANTIDSGIYVRRNAIENNATGSAGLHIKMEWK